MGKYRQIPGEVWADRWWALGDGPRDEEGKPLVEQYWHQSWPDTARCRHCGETESAHGWVGEGLPSESDIVCPGDWVVRFASGEVKAYRASEFEEHFEPVE